MLTLIKQLPETLWKWVSPNVTAFWAERQLLLWLLSLLIGSAVSLAAIAFRETIGLVQNLWLGTRSEAVVSTSLELPWHIIFLAPVIGGLAVGIALQTLLPARRTGGVADVIEARALSGRQLRSRPGLISALITAVSLGSGASAGREGPVVHLGATLASATAFRFDLPSWSRGTLLGCGVAAAISASFNAPIAGVLFAHEVILGHYAMRCFVPIVIAASAGGIISRLWFGEAAAFFIPAYEITSYLEFPAFALLGIVSAVVAIFFQFALFSADYLSRMITIPLWTRPAIGGVLLGAVGVFFPHILGVGYEATEMALWNRLPLVLMLILIPLKAIMTAITLASRFGGGIFSPALYLGAMTGGAFGLIAGSVFPELASSQALYSILGMGAVAGAVLGAPISTTVIVFELTGGYALSIALLLCVAISQGITQAIHGHSYFHWQLEMRGLFVQRGPHQTVMRNTKVMDFMRPVDPEEPTQHLDEEEPSLKPSDTLETALRRFDAGGHDQLPVVDESDQRTIVAWAEQVRALRYFNRALVAASEEEHR